MLCSLPSAIFYPDIVACSDRPLSSALTQLRPIKTFIATSRRRSEVRNLAMRHRLEVRRGDLRILHHPDPEVRVEIICDLVGHLRGGAGTDHQLAYVELSDLGRNLSIAEIREAERSPAWIGPRGRPPAFPVTLRRAKPAVRRSADRNGLDLPLGSSQVVPFVTGG